MKMKRIAFPHSREEIRDEEKKPRDNILPNAESTRPPDSKLHWELLKAARYQRMLQNFFHRKSKDLYEWSN